MAPCYHVELNTPNGTTKHLSQKIKEFFLELHVMRELQQINMKQTCIPSAALQAKPPKLNSIEISLLALQIQYAYAYDALRLLFK